MLLYMLFTVRAWARFQNIWCSEVEMCTHKAEQLQDAALCWKMPSMQINPWKVDQKITPTLVRDDLKSWKKMDRICEELITFPDLNQKVQDQRKRW